MQKAIHLAGRLGIRIIQLAGYDVYYETSDEVSRYCFQKNLMSCVEMASAYGIVLGFETMETSFMDTVEKAMFYVDRIKSPYLGIYPDIGNLKNASLLYGGEVNDDIQKGAGHIIATHLKETKAGIYREVPFGTGHSEFVKNITKLNLLGVRMYVAEFWYSNDSTWEKDIREAGVFLRNIMDDIF